MFSKPADRQLLHNRKILFSVTVLLLWFLQLIFLSILLFSVKSHLQQTIRNDLDLSLKLFVEKNRRLLFGPDVYASVLDEQSLGNLTFVRVIRNNEQLLLSTSADNELDFRSLAKLDPHQAGYWISLFDHVSSKASPVWNVASVSLAENVIVQVGSRDRYLYDMYRKLVRAFYVVLIPAFVIAVLISYMGFRLSLVPLNQLAEKLLVVQTGENELLDVASAGIKEHRRIYQRLNDIVLQNRQLVQEMQGSLDNVAHDLRTPMTRLRSVAEYGLQAGNDPLKLQSALSDCLEEAERVLAMLKIMMSVAEAETGMMRLECSNIDLAQSLADIVELYEYSAEDSEVEVLLSVSDGIEIYADHTRISQVWANLLDNAIKYNRQKGKVEIEAGLSGEMVQVTFRDSGIGISEQEIGRIWDRLYRGDRSRTRQGLGLGLNYVRAVVTAHGGSIRVDSVLNSGSTFVVTLPQNNTSVNRRQ